MITLDEARARGIALPADDDVAQDIIDEQEAWLAARIGPLEGDRTETFYVGLARTDSKLALRRSTDTVSLTDGGASVDADVFRLINDGSAVKLLTETTLQVFWRGPYVEATYEPNDATLVRKALFDLLVLALEPVSSMQGETIGAYAYTRGNVGAPSSARAIIVSGLLPKRDALYVVAVSRPIRYGDPIINRAEPQT